MDMQTFNLSDVPRQSHREDLFELSNEKIMSKIVEELIDSHDNL